MQVARQKKKDIFFKKIIFKKEGNKIKKMQY
jgi:hypothetical protein